MEQPAKGKDLQQAKTVVFRFLKYRLRSEWEIREKLKAKEFPANVTETTVDYFKKVSLIDDRLFAKGWIRSRLHKPYGVKRIRQELSQKRVAKDMIAEALAACCEDYDEQDTIRALARRRMKQYRTLDQTQKQRRLFNYLTRRGFSFDSVQKIVRDVTRDDDL